MAIFRVAGATFSGFLKVGDVANSPTAPNMLAWFSVQKMACVTDDVSSRWTYNGSRAWVRCSWVSATNMDLELLGDVISITDGGTH